MVPGLIEQLDVRDLREHAARIAKAHGVSLDDMFGRSVERHVVACRREFYRVLVEEMGWSASAVGKLVGRDHTSVRNALGKKRRKVADHDAHHSD